MKPVTGTRRQSLQLTCLLALAVFAPAAYAFQFHAAHSDPVAPVILGVTTILFVALLGRFGARHLGMPSVIGELGRAGDLGVHVDAGDAFADWVGGLFSHCGPPSATSLMASTIRV